MAESNTTVKPKPERSPVHVTLEHRPLWVELEVRGVGECPIRAAGDELVDVDRQILGGTCHSDIVVDDVDGVSLEINQEECTYRSDGADRTGCQQTIHATVPVTGNCICTVFHGFDLIPRVVSANADGVVIGTFLTDRSRLCAVVEALKGIADSVHLRRAVDDRRPQRTESVAIDQSLITEKQHDALRAAVENGYFETPRKTTLEALAAEFGISSAAFGQRLRAAQSKLAREAANPDHGHPR